MSAAAAKAKQDNRLGFIGTVLTILVLLTGFVGWVNATGSKADEALKKAAAVEKQQREQVTKDDFNRLGDRFDKLEQTVIRHLESEHSERRK